MGASWVLPSVKSLTSRSVWAIACWINFSARCTKFITKFEPVSRFLIDPKFVESTLVLDALDLLQQYEPISIFLIDPIAIACWINFSVRCTKCITKYEPVSRFLIDPIACWINFSARCTKFITKYEPVSRFLIYPIACWINFSARCTKFCAKLWASIKIFNWPNSYYILNQL